MMGRMDVVRQGSCYACGGSGKDRRRRTRPCPKCDGTGKGLVCSSCGESMPCSGTDPNMFDQSSCNKDELQEILKYIDGHREGMLTDGELFGFLVEVLNVRPWQLAYALNSIANLTLRERFEEWLDHLNPETEMLFHGEIIKPSASLLNVLAARKT